MNHHHLEQRKVRQSLGLAHAYVPPASEIEKTITEIWQTLLNIDQIGIYDDFFELGGDSILLIQAVTQLNKRGFLLDPEQLFQVESADALVNQSEEQPIQALKVPTIAKLAWLISSGQAQTTEGTNSRQLLEQIEQLSPEEIDHFLEQLLADEEMTHE